jgi:hypothetical protein
MQSVKVGALDDPCHSAQCEVGPSPSYVFKVSKRPEKGAAERLEARMFHRYPG